jgi:splicing factor 3B subunit 5
MFSGLSISYGTSKQESITKPHPLVLSPQQIQYTTYNITMSNPGGAGISTEQLKARYVGTGHTDMSKYEWLTNQHRDTYASHIGHYDQLSYFAVAQNESIGRVRLQFLEKMVQPCGPPPPTKNVDKLLEEKTMGD